MSSTFWKVIDIIKAEHHQAPPRLICAVLGQRISLDLNRRCQKWEHLECGV